jgi:Cell Wall Hydrolase
MSIMIRRKRPGALINLQQARLGVLLLTLIVAACVSQAAQFRRIPGVRDAALAIPLDPPTAPGGDVAAYQAAAEEAMNLTAEEIGLPAGMTPEMLFAMQSGGPMPATAMPVSANAIVDPAAPPPVGTPPAIAPKPAAPSNRFVSFAPGVPAAATSFRSRSAIDNLRAAICLASAIYYEAASESDDGQRAVAQVVLNRVRHPAYPNTVCGVVFQGTERGDRLCQFSFACDGSMRRTPPRAAWIKARRIADEALAGRVFEPVGYATHYHTLAVNPAWGPKLVKAAIIGAHIFYRMPSVAGLPGSFRDAYRGGEPAPEPKTPIYKQVPLPTPQMATLAPYQLPLAPPAPTTSAQAKAPAAIAEAPAPRTPVANIQPEYVRSGDPIAGSRPVTTPTSSGYAITPESNIQPEYRDSGTWIKR